MNLTHHCDHGSQYTSIACSEKLADYGIRSSYKAELIYSHPWASLTEVEFATLNWVHWWNNERLHEALGYRTPADIIDMYNQTRVSELTPV
ncbi:MAG: integrase core domain-containing protein [Varibaculum cambriense]|nr:integrase core domain-containing protein [Varibaculum cambriense]